MRDDYEGFAPATGVGAGIREEYEGFAPAREEDWI